mgnify:FL=1
MLKTQDGSTTWLIDQPAHGALAGLLAAHWGNSAFAQPGGFGDGAVDEVLRREVILAIASHDNGWWEWEASPQEGEDGLPQGLEEVLGHPSEGMQRWKLGVRRLAERHPYASLLIGDHAAWLYAAQFEDDFPQELVHPIQRERKTYPPEMRALAADFLQEIRALQSELEQRLSQEPWGRLALQQRLPHSRLLQILDAVSLAMGSALLGPRGLGRDPLTFTDVPRTRWEERGDLKLIPGSEGQLVLDPYPFDKPLEVTVVARPVKPGQWWRQVAPELLRFRLDPPG